MNYKKANILSVTIMALGLVAALAFIRFGESSNEIKIWSVFIVSAFFIGGSIIRIAFYRCPYCKGSLPFRSSTPKHCPHCGQELEPRHDEDDE